MLVQNFEATNGNEKHPSESMLEYAKNTSLGEYEDIYLYWNDRQKIYVVSDNKNLFAPIISGGWTPQIVAHYKNGKLIS